MLKKAREFLLMTRCWRFDTIVGIIPSHVQYTLDEFVAIVVLAQYYCHTDDVVRKIIEVMVSQYPEALRTDRVINPDYPEVIVSWFSTRSLILVLEEMKSETDLETIVNQLKKECFK